MASMSIQKPEWFAPSVAFVLLSCPWESLLAARIAYLPMGMMWRQNQQGNSLPCHNLHHYEELFCCKGETLTGSE